MSDKPLLKKADFQSDQAIRWCPGCGDYAILAQTQKTFPEIRNNFDEFELCYPQPKIFLDVHQ